MRIELDEGKLKKTLELILAGKAETDLKQTLAYISSLEKAVKEESRNKGYRTATGARYITGLVSEYSRFLGKTKALAEKGDFKAAGRECAEFAKMLEESGIVPKPNELKRQLNGLGLSGIRFKTRAQAETFGALMANPMLTAAPLYKKIGFATNDQMWWSLLALTFIHLIGQLVIYALAEEKDKQKHAKWVLIAFAMFAGVLLL